VETDDPRWIDCERAMLATSDAETDAAIPLVDVTPTTRAGLMALLNYAVSNDTDGEGWPLELVGDDEKKHCWHHFLLENVLKALSAETASEIMVGHAVEAAAAPSRAAALWAERQTYVVKNNALGEAYQAAYDQLPAWAQSGPRLLAHDGTYCGGEVGWPLDPSIKPSEHPSAYRVCRVSPHDIKRSFEFTIGMFPEMNSTVRAKHRATMRESLRKLIARVREQRAEKDRLGLLENERQSEALNAQQFQIEDAIREGGQTPDAKAAAIMVSLQDNCGLDSSAAEDSEMSLACVALDLLLPQLTGLIREHAAFYLENRTATLREMPFARA
jgi:hypothetical protein